MSVDLIVSDHFNRDQPGPFEPLRGTLLTQGDYYMHPADLTPYVKAQERLSEQQGALIAFEKTIRTAYAKVSNAVVACFFKGNWFRSVLLPKHRHLSEDRQAPSAGVSAGY